MAGHSKWANTKHRKGAQDAKKAKIFTKIAREIEAAVSLGGSDANSNPRLRNAIIDARSVNMPNDRISKAVNKGSGSDKSNYEQVTYECYGPNGIAFIVETLTDNRNRTSGFVRSIFTKFGGSMGETGSVEYLFDRLGVVEYSSTGISEEKLFEIAVENGANSVEKYDDIYEITCEVKDLHSVQESLAKIFGDASSVAIIWRAKSSIEIDKEKFERMMKIIDNLEDDDDIQNVYNNFEYDEE